jgi:SAM-dependent methyltransferase
MNSEDYRKIFYARYVSLFKAHSLPPPDYAFSDAKLMPLLGPWTANLPRSTACLDLGCGAGNILHLLRALGFTDVAGVDISAEQIELARKISPQAHCGDIMEALIKYGANSLGLITIFDVLEHLTKPEQLALMQSCAERLMPGGVLIAHLPNGDSPFAGAVMASDYTHETLLSPGSAKVLCKIVGLGEFAAAEHLGASTTFRGRMRRLLWAWQRFALQLFTLVECGHSGPKILTRNFAFRAIKAR